MTEDLAISIGVLGLTGLLLALLLLVTSRPRWALLFAAGGAAAVCFALTWSYHVPVRMNDLRGAIAIKDEQLAERQRELDEAKHSLSLEKSNVARVGSERDKLLSRLSETGGRLRLWLKQQGYGDIEQSPATGEDVWLETAIARLLTAIASREARAKQANLDRAIAAVCLIGDVQRQTFAQKSSYSMEWIPDTELVASNLGKYVRIRLLNTETGREHTFEDRHYIWADTAAVVRSLEALRDQLLAPLTSLSNIKVYLKGNADARDVEGSIRNEQATHPLYVHKLSVDNQRYGNAAERYMPSTQLRNEDLPNLRAANTLPLLRSAMPELAMNILDNQPSQETGAHLRTVEIILFIPH